MRQLILVKHSMPEIVPNRPANEWHLSTEGRQRCHELAERLSVYQPAAIVSSVEPKAMETAALLASSLGRGWETAHDLHEHDRSNVAYLGPAAFEEAVATFFERPTELVFGLETAQQALERFLSAIEAILKKYSTGNSIVVAHGTVITLFVAHYNNVKPFPLWKSLGLPSFLVLSLPSYQTLSPIE